MHKYRVWCAGSRQWEKDQTLLDHDGTLFHLGPVSGRMTICRPDIHIIQFFTGVLDINGKEIFEGDICRRGYSSRYGSFFYNYPVIYVEKDTCFGLGEVLSYSRLTVRMVKKMSIEVIGNIFQHPELLRKEK